MRIRIPQRRLLTAASAAILLAALAPRGARAQSFNVTVSPSESNFSVYDNYAGDSYALSWSAVVDPSSPTATVSYAIFQSFGLSPTVNPYANGTVVSSGTTNTSITLYGGPGTLCFGVQAFDFESANLGQAVVACHPYQNSTEDGNDGDISRVDGDGQQLGYDDTWEFSYYLDNDSIVTASIYPSTTTFTTDADGFPEPEAGAVPLDVFESSVPDPGNVQITDVWDTRDTNGDLVPNGLYSVYYQVQDQSDNLRWAQVYSVPVDLLRILDFTTSGISPTSSLADVNFNITEAASVRIVIANPGTVMEDDSDGNVQATDGNGNITTSTSVVVETFTYQEPSGANTVTWNGTDESGVPVSSGVYSVGISAVDAYGNAATDADGNYQVIQGVIPVDRTSNETGLPTTPPSITQVAVNSSTISLSGGSVLTGSFNTIAITLSDTAGSGSDSSQVTLTGPSGGVAGTVSESGDVVTFATSGSISSTGTYTLDVTAEDTYGNIAAAQTINFSLATPTPPSVASVAVNGSTIALTGSSVLANETVTSIAVTLNEAGGTGADSSVITLNGPNGSLAGSVGTAGDVVTFTPAISTNSAGNYTISVVAKDTNGDASSQLNYSFTLSAPTPPSIVSVAVGGSTISLSGGSAITGSFNSIAVTLNETGGTGADLSLVTLSGPNGSVPGSVSSSGDVVTFSTGTLASTGTYTVTVTAKDNNGDTASPVAVSFTLAPITISFTAFSTSGISPTVSLGDINYTISANATVRVLIAQPGRSVVDDSNGNVQSLNAAGTAIDMTTASVVQVFTVPVTAGGNVTTWNGQNSLGVAVPAGLYTVGLSALDASGHESTNLSGVVAPVAGTISVNRTGNQTGGNTASPSVTAIAVGVSTISLTGGSILSSTFTAITVTLNAAAGTGVNTSSATLTNPAGSTVPGTLGSVGDLVTFTAASAQTSTGTYVLNLVAVDNNGNVAAPASYNFVLVPAGSVAASGSGSGSGTGSSGSGSGSSGSGAGSESCSTCTETAAYSFSASLINYPNPVKAAPATIQFVLPSGAAGTATIDIYTILGRRVYHTTLPAAAGTNDVPWYLTNDSSNLVADGVYLVRVTANTGTNSYSAITKLMVLR